MDVFTVTTSGETYYVTGANMASMRKWVQYYTREMYGRGATEGHCYEQEHLDRMLANGYYKMSTENPQCPARPQATQPARCASAATPAQINYLNILGVKREDGMTKSRASELIDAAKSGMLGSVGGWYTDGSN